MSFPNGCGWVRIPGLRIRPVPELRQCLVYRPKPPKLFRLNLAAWLALELCDGSDRARVLSAYREAVGNHVSGADAAMHVDRALELLVNEGLICRKQETLQ